MIDLGSDLASNLATARKDPGIDPLDTTNLLKDSGFQVGVPPTSEYKQDAFPPN